MRLWSLAVIALLFSIGGVPNQDALAQEQGQGQEKKTDPPKAKKEIKKPEEKLGDKGFNFTIEVTGDKGTVKLPEGVKDLEPKTVDLAFVKKCSIACLDIYFYRGAVKGPIKVNKSGFSKCGSVVVMTDVKKKDLKCDPCNVIAIQIGTETASGTDTSGRPIPETTIGPFVDSDPALNSASFAGYFTDGIIGNATSLYFDFIGPAHMKPPEDFKERTLKHKFRTWFFCKEKGKPPCVLGYIDFSQTIVETVDPGKSFKCEVKDEKGPECSAAPVAVDDEFKKALEQFINDVKESEDFKKDNKEQQEQRLNMFNDLMKAKACDK